MDESDCGFVRLNQFKCPKAMHVVERRRLPCLVLLSHQVELILKGRHPLCLSARRGAMARASATVPSPSASSWCCG